MQPASQEDGTGCGRAARGGRISGDCLQLTEQRGLELRGLVACGLNTGKLLLRAVRLEVGRKRGGRCWSRWCAGHACVESLWGLAEHNLIVALMHHRLLRHLVLLAVRLAVQLERVVELKRRAQRVFLEVYLHTDLKLAPAGLRELVGRRVHGAVGIGKTRVQLKHHLGHPRAQVLVAGTPDVHCPFVAVIFRCLLSQPEGDSA
mmetsp:Transcript_27464/g.70600  ORF Transcript_27464/g.70600 Transcript_27464/m.70600 type:complete len:204 (+) Transcript_27464:291-902(+)